MATRLPRRRSPLRLGIDTGGTFTDLVAFGPDGLLVDKQRSTPEAPARAILAGVAALAGDAERDIVHGSTVATNAVLERKGARVALVTTAGFEDVIRIGRQTRPELYNIFVAPRPSLVDPSMTFGLVERLDARGRVLTPLDPAAVDRLAAVLATRPVDIVAVCFLHAYINPVHENLAAARLGAAGFVVSTSHSVLPEYREYERWSTTTVNAFVTPLVDRYLRDLEAGVGRARLTIMQSNGGVISAAAARRQAIRTVLSGPAGGVVGARAAALEAGFPRLISFDMGGTSTDVSLIDGEPSITPESTVGGFPVRLPMLDIHTVGAGGGSIARIDSGGALRVGPDSAGAVPGPACYGEGTDLTVTDANLILGRLDPARFFGGRMALDLARAQRSAAALARQLKTTVPELAEAVIRVANSNMERAIRVVSVARGHDPRRFALVAFGGAGGMHACEVADRLEIPTIVVPRHAGVLSALGMLVADVTRDYSASVLAPSHGVTLAELTRRLAPLVDRARAELADEGLGRRHQRIERQIDVRYAGQSYELTLPFGADYRSRFHREHGRRYGYSNPDRPTEVVNVRVRATGVISKPQLPRFPRGPVQPDHRAARRSDPSRPAIAPDGREETRRTRFDGRVHEARLYRWDHLVPDFHSRGPAIITGAEATIVIPPRFQFRVDRFGNVIATH